MDEFLVDNMNSTPPDQEAKEACRQKLLAIFQGICPKYLEEVAEKWNYCANDIAEDIVEQQESGFKYPRLEKKKDAKRKRDEPEDAIQEMRDIRLTYTKDGMEAPTEMALQRMYQLLQEEFPHVPFEVVSGVAIKNRHSLFSAYLILYRLMQNRQGADRRGPAPNSYVPDLALKVPSDVENSMRTELLASRRYCALQTRLTVNPRAKEQFESKNYQYAEAHGLLRECGCCFTDVPLNRMVSCAGEPSHLFCTECPRNLAKTMIGQSRYKLQCLSVDGCSAAFSHTERAKFLDKGLTTALERIEQDIVLRSANIEGLVTCPFCTFAAICVPEEENKEFPCQNPDCAVVSCRLCKSETHVPLSCEEAAQKVGISARHQIEEAMSAAMIRKCNSCHTPFVKILGCNKVTCTRCGNIQCDVCSETCDYTHFNENRPRTATVTKGCPLYDNAEIRYAREVDAAEKQTRERLANEHPEIDAQYLTIPKAPLPERRRRAPILGMFGQNARQNLPQNAPQQVPQDYPRDGRQEGNQEGHQEGHQEDHQEGHQEDHQDGYELDDGHDDEHDGEDDYGDGYDDGSQDGYEDDYEGDSQQEVSPDEEDDSADENEPPNKRQRREPNEAVGIRNPEIPRAPRPHPAVPNPVPAQPELGLAQLLPHYNFPLDPDQRIVIIQNKIMQWPDIQQPQAQQHRQQEQQQQQQHQHANVQQQQVMLQQQQQQQRQQQQQHVNVQQPQPIQQLVMQQQANAQQQQIFQQQANARQQQMLQQQVMQQQASNRQQQVMQQQQALIQQANLQVMRAHHHAQLQAQQFLRMKADERTQQGHMGTEEHQRHAVMQARRRQERLQLLIRAQNQMHQEGQLVTHQLMQQLGQQLEEEQTQQQAQHQVLQQPLQPVPSPWDALEQALSSHHETLRQLSELGVPQLAIPQYIPRIHRPLNQLGAQQQALPQHQAGEQLTQLQAQQQGPAGYGHGMPPPIVEEGKWGLDQYHRQ